MKLAIQISDETEPSIDIAVDRIRWRGRSDLEAEAPALVWELADPEPAVHRAFAELDPDALGTVASTLPMPTGMLADLAVRCIAHASSDPMHRALREEQTLAIARSDVGTDVRWARALAQAWIDRGVPAGAVPEVAVELLVPQGDDRIRHVSVLGDGRVVALVLGSHTGLRVFDGASTRELALPDDGVAWLEVLRSLPGETEDPATVVIAAVHPAEAWIAIAIVDLEGRVHAHGGAALEGWPRKASRSTGAIWIHTDSHHLRYAIHEVAADAPVTLATALARPAVAPELARFERGPVGGSVPITAGRWLLHFHGTGAIAESIGWISLDDGHVAPLHPWGTQLVQLVRDPDGDTLWATTAAGLYRLVGGEPPVLVWTGAVNGVAVAPDGTAAWLGLAAEPTVVEIDLATGAERWRTTLPQPAYTVRVAPGGILAALSAFSWLDRRGAILMTAEDRRDPVFAMLADGTAAASCGEQVAIVAPDGELRRCAPFSDGGLLGATRDRFVFGPRAGGYHLAADELVAFDRAGRLTARVAWPDKSIASHHVAFTATHAYLVDARGLVRFDPRGPADPRTSVQPPPPRRPTERDTTRHGLETVNPRDDFPEIGIEIVHSSGFAIRCDYGGSEGVYSEVPIRIGDGAIVTLVDCTLIRGGSGSIVQRASTLVLVRCKLPSGHWKLGHHCHLVLVDCVVAGLRVEAGPGSAVVANAPMVRDGDHWRIG